MKNNRIRSLVRNAVGSSLIASALGLSALGLAGGANAAPVHDIPQHVHCNVFINGWYAYSYPGHCR
jgi:hypothetical protein